jgi:RsiW-degrading membrane proteinase PrsW (M82 family)
MLLLTFLVGILSILPAMALEWLGMMYTNKLPNLLGHWLNAFVVIAFSEELAKYMFLKWFAYRSSHFDEPFDGIIYALMVSMGFAALENIMYVLNGGITVALMRMFTAVPAHATFAVLMGSPLPPASVLRRIGAPSGRSQSVKRADA